MRPITPPFPITFTSIFLAEALLPKRFARGIGAKRQCVCVCVCVLSEYAVECWGAQECKCH